MHKSPSLSCGWLLYLLVCFWQPIAISDQQILEMVLFPVVNEGCRVVEEGIVVRPSDLNVATVLGMSFPSYRYYTFTHLLSFSDYEMGLMPYYFLHVGGKQSLRCKNTLVWLTCSCHTLGHSVTVYQTLVSSTNRLDMHRALIE